MVIPPLGDVGVARAGVVLLHRRCVGFWDFRLTAILYSLRDGGRSGSKEPDRPEHGSYTEIAMPNSNSSGALATNQDAVAAFNTHFAKELPPAGTVLVLPEQNQHYELIGTRTWGGSAYFIFASKCIDRKSTRLNSSHT